MARKDKTYHFTATGGWTIDSKLKPETDHAGNVVAFRLPDGRKAQLVVALEVESKDETDYKYIVSERDMEKIGFSCLDYDRLEFCEG